MSDKVILIDDLGTKEENLEEFVFRCSAGGTVGLSKIDIEQIDPDERMRALNLLKIYQKNPGIFETRKIKSEEKIEDKTISLEEAEERWDDFSDKERKKFLKASVDLENELREKQQERKIERMPEDIKTLVSLSDKDWKDLPGNGRKLILQKLNFLEEQTRKIPDIKGFDKLSEDKRKAILKSLS